MEKQKRYQELLTRLESYEKKNVELASEIAILGTNRDSLQEEVLRAEVLGDPGWKDKKAEAELNCERWQRLKEEEAKGIQAVAILRAELDRTVDEVAEEIRRQFRLPFEKSIKAFVSKLKDAAAAEAGVKDVLNKCETIFSSLGIKRLVGLEWSGSVVNKDLGELVNRVVERCRQNGFDVD